MRRHDAPVLRKQRSFVVPVSYRDNRYLGLLVIGVYVLWKLFSYVLWIVVGFSDIRGREAPEQQFIISIG